MRWIQNRFKTSRRTRLKRCVCAVVLFCPLRLMAGEVVVTLESAIDQALLSDPLLLQTQEREREGQALSRLALSKTLTTIDGTFEATRERDSLLSAKPRFDGDSFNSYRGEIKATQPVLVRGFLSGVFAAHAEKDLRQIDAEIAKRNVTFATIQAFYKVLLNARRLEILKKSDQIRKQSLQEAEHRRKIGRGQLLDVLQMKTQIALLIPQIEKASNDLKSSSAELAKQMGIRDGGSLVVRGQLNPPELDRLKEKLEGLTPRVFEIERSEKLQEETRRANTVVMGKHWPRLDLEGAISRTGYKKGDLTNSDANAWSVGLLVKVPLFSGLGSFHERASLESQELQQHWEEIKIRDQFSLDQVKSREDLESAQSVIQSSKAAYELAEDSLTEAKKNYRVATIDSLQLLSIEENVLNAELNLEQAKFDYVGVLTRFFTAAGYSAGVLVESLKEST